MFFLNLSPPFWSGRRVALKSYFTTGEQSPPGDGTPLVADFQSCDLTNKEDVERTFSHVPQKLPHVHGV